MVIRAPSAPFGRFLFGRDFFISYSRRDGAAYAATLASRLSTRFSCYLDQLASPRGAKLPAPIGREVKRATVLALVGTAGALESMYVGQEIRLFLGTGRPVLLLDIDGALERAPWDAPPWSGLVGVYRQRESLDAFQRAEPSEALLHYLHDSFTFTRQDRRLRSASTAATILLAATAGISVFASRRARDAARRASEARAEEAIARASAEEQRRIAASRRLAGESSAQIGERPDLGLLLAAAAHDAYPTAEARRSLFAGLQFHPGLTRMIRDPHGGDVQALAVSADGRVFATGSHTVITVWNAGTLEPGARIVEPGENFRGLALSPDGSLIAACRSRHVTLVDAATSHAIGRIDAATNAVSFIGRELLAIGEGNVVEVWDVSAPERPVATSRLALDENVQAVAGHPSGRYVVAATFKRVVVCSPVPCEIQQTLTSERDIGLTTLALPSDPEAELVAATNAGGRLAVWNAVTGERLASLSLVGGLGDRQLFQAGSTPGGDLFAVAFDREGEHVTTGSLRGRFAIGAVEELANWTALQQAPAEMRDAEMALIGMTGEVGLRQRIYAPGIIGLAFAGDTPRLIVQQVDNALSVWDGDGRLLLEQTTPWPDEVAGHASHVFSADARSSVYALRGALSVWGVGGAEPPVRLLPDFGERARPKTAMAPDGEVVAAIAEVDGGTPTQTVNLWDRHGTLLSQTPIDARVAPAMAARTETLHAVIGGPAPGRLLVAAFANRTLVVWNIADPSNPRLLSARAFENKAEAMAINPAKPQIAIADRKGALVIWDVDDGGVRVLSGDLHEAVALRFSPDGRRLTAFARPGEIGRETSRVASWDLGSGQPHGEWLMDERDRFTMSLDGHSLDTAHVTISPDGAVVALADGETVALWDVESHALLAAFRLPDRIDSLTFVSDGDALLAKRFGGLSRLDVGPQSLAARARDIAGRSLTEEEAQRFLIAATLAPSHSSHGRSDP